MNLKSKAHEDLYADCFQDPKTHSTVYVVKCITRKKGSHVSDPSAQMVTFHNKWKVHSVRLHETLPTTIHGVAMSSIDPTILDRINYTIKELIKIHSAERIEKLFVAGDIKAIQDRFFLGELPF